VPSPIGFQNIHDDRFLQLRRQAMQFVEARSRQGYQFVDQREGAALQIYCRDVPVLWLERRPIICCCGYHWMPGSGRRPLCSCGPFFNGRWNLWAFCSRRWPECLSLF
jgi:hypothetical protein